MGDDLRTTTANGIRFSYVEVGRGPLVLLLHGFPDTARTWRDVQPRIAAAGHRVVAPYMRGYPPTEAPLDASYSAVELGRDVLALVRALGEESAIVVGHDWGAFAAYAAASLEPACVRKLVVVSIPHPASLGMRGLAKARHFITFQLRGRAIAELSRDDYAGVEAIWRRWSPSMRIDREELEDVKRSFAAGGLEGALRYYEWFRKDALGLSGAARRVLRAKTSVPTLAIFGEADGALDLSGIDRTPAFFTGGYDIVRLPGVGHFVHREAPDAFVDAVLAFLASRGRRD